MKENPCENRYPESLLSVLSHKDLKEIFLELEKEVMFTIVDDDGKIIYANDKFLELVKYSKNELIGSKIQNLRSGWYTEDYYKKIWEIIRSSLVWHGEINQKTKDGFNYWVDTLVVPILDLNKKIKYYFTIFYLITDPNKICALKEESQYTRSLLESSLDPLGTIDINGKITDINSAVCEILGLPREKIIGNSVFEYFTEPQKALEGVLQAFEKGSLVNYPLSVRKSDGNIIQLLWSASVYKDYKGKVAGLFAYSREITEYSKILEQSKETKNYLDNVLQSSIKYSIVGVDLDLTILNWNEGARRIYEYSSEEMIGKSAKILFTQEEIESGELQNVLEEALSKGFAEREFIRPRKDGTLFPSILNVTMRYNPEGQPIGFVFMSYDMTDEKARQEKIIQASLYNRSLIEASLDPLVTINADGQITDVNEAFVKVTGVPRSKLIGTDFFDYFTDPQKAREGYQQVFAKGKIANYPLTIRHLDGHLTDVFYNASVYKDKNGNVLGVFAAARDVTPQLNAEKNLANHLEELEKLQNITINRELEMIELKKQIEILEKERDRLKSQVS